MTLLDRLIVGVFGGIIAGLLAAKISDWRKRRPKPFDYSGPGVCPEPGPNEGGWL